jgi:hypothetical protein
MKYKMSRNIKNSSHVTQPTLGYEPLASNSFTGLYIGPKAVS